jgi:WD40 repeat protein
MAGTARYHAFFSYSHAADGALAPAFRLALHKFAKPWYRTRALSVFLDQSSLSANPGLWPAIERALSDSEYFVLLASPDSAASPWVRKEIDWWLRNRSVEKMLVLLTGGDLCWDASTADFDWQRTTAIARELAGRFPDEPLYVDLRWAKAEESLSLRSPRFRAAVVDIAAPLHGRSKDELDGEDIRQNRRALRLARGAVMLLAVFAGAAVWQAVVARRQRDEAVRQRDLAQARSLTAEANRQFANPLQWNLAMLLAVESMRKASTADNYEALVRLSREGARVVASFPGQYLTAFSADGRWIATQIEQHLVVREARGGRERARIPAEGMSSAFTDICFTPGGERVLGHNREQAILADVARQQRVALPIETPRGGLVAVSPDCRFLATGNAGRGRLIDLESATLIGDFALLAMPAALAASSDGDTVAYADGVRTTIVSARTGAVRGQWVGDQEITGAAFRGDATQLAVWLRGKGLVILDAASGRRLSESPATGALTRGFELAADMAGADGRELVTWDVGSGTWTKRMSLRRAGTNLDWSLDGEFLGYGTDEGDGSARVLQSESWRQLARFAFLLTLSNTPAASPSAVRVRVSPSGDLASATDANRAAVFEVHHDRPAVTVPPSARPGPIALSGDGTRAAFRSVDRKMVVIESASGRPLAEFACSHSGRDVHSLSSNGHIVIGTCGGSTALLYSVDDKRLVASLPIPYASPVAISRDGTFAFAGSTVVRAADAERVRDVGGGRVAALDPRGRRIALGDGAQIRLFDLDNDSAPRQLDADINNLESVAFSEDGSLLAAGGRDMRVKLFDTSSGRMIRLLEHIEQDQWVFRIHRLVFSPRGRLIATMADDPTSTDRGRPGTLRVFEVSTGREVARMPFPELAHDLRFTADDAYLEVAVGRRRIRWERFPLSAAEMIRNGCALVQRNMDPLEWARFMGEEPRRDTCPVP